MAWSCVIGWAQVPDYVPTDGLSAWYDFNANLIDGSGNSDDAQNHGATFGPDRWGNELFAVDFTGPEQWVETSPWLTGIQNNFTLSIWFNLRSFEAQDSPGANIFHHRAHWKDKRLTTGFHESTGQSLGESIKYGDRQFSGTNYLDLYSQSIELNVWNHVVVSGDNSNFFLFVNGELIDQTPRTFDSDWSGSFYGAYLGANGYESAGTMNGMVDEFGAWSRTLSILEIQGLFAAGELVVGCIDEQACNFNPEANVGDDSCIPSGCIDSQACNFSPEAECEGEACDYTCCPGPGCCSNGHYWDWDLEKCFDIAPSDTDFDGCVSMTDLLDLLSVFGTCIGEEPEEDPEMVEWSCGDPVGYQGYDYETVQIGEQCWFAENARYLPYVTPPSNDGTRVLVYDYYGSNVEEASQLETYQSYGALYNWSALANVQICPNGWHIPSDPDWMELETLLGMPSNELQGTGFRGTTEGIPLKSPIIGGTNETGFSGLGGGMWNWHESSFVRLHENGIWWAASQNGQYPYSRQLRHVEEGIYRHYHPQGMAFSVRCIQDSE